MKAGWIPDEYDHAYLLKNTTMTGKMRHGMVELIFYNKVVVIREKDES